VKDVALACRVLAGEGHGDLCFGHVSTRQGDGFAVKAAGPSLAEVWPEDVALVRADGSVEPPGALMHLELPLHAEIYRALPDAGAVVHTHPPSAVIVSHDPALLAPVSQDGVAVHGRVAFADGPPLIETREHGVWLATAIAQRPALLLRGHGLVTRGSDLIEATVLAVLVERACRASLAARAAGVAPSPLATDGHDVLAARSRDEAIWRHLIRAHSGSVSEQPPHLA
jgi:L-fuculose-phosphate aldolase